MLPQRHQTTSAPTPHRPAVTQTRRRRSLTPPPTLPNAARRCRSPPSRLSSRSPPRSPRSLCKVQTVHRQLPHPPTSLRCHILHPRRRRPTSLTICSHRRRLLTTHTISRPSACTRASMASMFHKANARPQSTLLPPLQERRQHVPSCQISRRTPVVALGAPFCPAAPRRRAATGQRTSNRPTPRRRTVIRRSTKSCALRS